MDTSLGSLVATTGLVAASCGCIAWYLKHAHIKYDVKRNEKSSLSEAVQSVNPMQLASLIHSPISSVRNAAARALVDIASEDTYIIRILSQCVSDDSENMLKSLIVINMLAKTPSSKAGLLQNGVMHSLCSLVQRISDGYKWQVLHQRLSRDGNLRFVLKLTLGSMQLLAADELFAVLSLSKELDFVQYVLLNIMASDSNCISTELRCHATTIVFRLYNLEMKSLQEKFVEWGIIRKTTRCLLNSVGDTLQSILCLKILLHFIGSYSQQEEAFLKEMALHGILPALFGLLRSEDDESLIRLTTVMIHEYCSSNIEKITISKLPCLVKILFNVLSSSGANVQHTVLRIFSYLALGNTRVQKLLLDFPPLIKRLSVCLMSGHRDVVHWSVVLVHDLAMGGKGSTETLVKANPEIIKGLVSLAQTSDNNTTRLIAETLGFVCACDSLHEHIIKYSVIELVLKFASNQDVEIQFWASALLLNLSMSSDAVKRLIVRNGGLQTLLKLALSSDESELSEMSINATKTLVILGFADVKMSTCLRAGAEASILIDGIERCPGKPGINMVMLNLLDFKFAQPSVVESRHINLAGRMPYFEALRKGGLLFAVTQGPCSLIDLGWTFFEEALEFQNLQWSWEEAGVHVGQDSWAITLVPGTFHVTSGGLGDDVVLKADINLSLLVCHVVQRQLAAPLLDLLMSLPPASSASKVEELEVISVLARHPFQRKAMVDTSGFFEYLCELVWVVVESRPFDGIFKPDGVIKLAHSIGALKLLHALSADQSSKMILINRGLLRLLSPLLYTICNYVIENCQLAPTNGTGPAKLKEEKPAWFDMINIDECEPGLTETASSRLPMADSSEVARIRKQLSGNHSFTESMEDGQARWDETIAIAEDHEEEQASPVQGACEYPDDDDDENAEILEDSFFGVLQGVEPIRDTTLPTLGDVDEEPDAVVDDSPVHILGSAVAQSDCQETRRIHRSASMAGLVDSPTAAPSVPEEASRRSRSGSQRDGISRQHMRRLSRSLSVALQNAKSAEQDLLSALNSFDDSLYALAHYALLTIYHLLRDVSDEDRLLVSVEVAATELIPCVVAARNCLQGDRRARLVLAISVILENLTSLMTSVGEVSPSCSRRYVCVQPYGGQSPQEESSLLIGPDNLEVCSEHWIFETVRATQGVCKTMLPSSLRGWYYEVHLFTNGIIQIGWAAEESLFDRAKGIGVGDNIDSIGYDGSRCKIWHCPPGQCTRDNTYGIKWQCGDTVSVLLSKEGLVSYWLNGRDMGVAFDRLDTDKMWYPAVSLSINQHCSFTFLRRDFRYKPPAGYATIQEVLESLAQSVDVPCALEEASLGKFATGTKRICLNNELVRVNWNEEWCLLYYFEVHLGNPCCLPNSLQVGFQAVGLVHTEHKHPTGSLRANLKPDGEFGNVFYVACGDDRVLDRVVRPQLFIGCGLLYPNRVFFVIDGDDILVSEPLVDGESHASSTGSSSQRSPIGTRDRMLDVLSVLPFVSLPCAHVNYGQRSFLFNKANSPKINLTSARSLCHLISVSGRV